LLEIIDLGMTHTKPMKKLENMIKFLQQKKATGFPSETEGPFHFCA
jgi:hypothetical protein